MKSTTLSLLALAGGLGEVAATFGFLDANPFTCPKNTVNRCGSKQPPGYTWGGLANGPFNNFGGMAFNKWECDQGFLGFSKRDRLAPRNPKPCAKGTASYEKPNCPSFGVDKDSDFDLFSIDGFFLDVEFDTDLELHYDMPDGSLCKHRASCKKGGADIKNSQCGGAKHVTVVLPPLPTHTKKSCGVAIHTMSFHCDTTTKSVPHISTTTKALPTTTSTTTSAPYVTTTSDVKVITSTVFTTIVSTVVKCGSNVTECPSHSTTVTTVTVAVSTTICPVTETSSSTYVLPPPPATTTTTKAPVTTVPQPPATDLPCPPLVPQCINTWLFILECKDNTDHGCYCPSAAFVENIYTCFYAHGETDVVINEAIIFFQGICAPHIPSNPGIVTCPNTLTYVTEKPTRKPEAVYTTVVVTATEVVPCTTEGHGGSTTLISTQYATIPQLGFETGPSGGVGVIPIATLPAAEVANPTTVATAKPYSTGGYNKPSASQVIVSGAGRTSTGVAAAVAIALLGALAAL